MYHCYCLKDEHQTLQANKKSPRNIWDDLVYHRSFKGLIIIHVKVLEDKYFFRKP